MFSALLGLSLATGLSQAASPAEKAVKASKPASKVSGLLYELSLPPTPGIASVNDHKRDKTIAYLYGSIHIAKKDFYPLAKVVKQSYAKADTLVVETDITDENANRSIIGKLSYIAPDRLEHHLSAETWNTLRDMTGQSLEQFQFYKPVLVAMGLTVSAGMQLGFEPEQGLDLHFIKAAQKDKKKLIELDGVAVQAEVLNNLSNEEGDAILANTLQSFKNGEIRQEFQRMTEAWRAADADKLAQIFVAAANKDSGSKKITQKLIDDRNPDTAKKIIELMSSGKKLFIVVGAGHLAGDNNLIKLFQQQGLQVRQIH
ncbi:TraB/GumN family protein [Undibacterium sp. Ji22W]|uniref:TraB/GumN family protein n=1 Tax=Undibacterium sp. Ji22W TaxID=3413038 RepID=UPI003BF3F82B